MCGSAGAISNQGERQVFNCWEQRRSEHDEFEILSVLFDFLFVTTVIIFDVKAPIKLEELYKFVIIHD